MVALDFRQLSKYNHSKVTKSETIWQLILESALNKKGYQFTQQAIARSLGYSLSTVNHAIDSPTRMGALKKSGRFFTLVDFKKLLYYWASRRQLSRDLIYQTYSPLTIWEREGLVPPTATLAGYSAARYWLKEAAADYDKLYFYLTEKDLIEAEKRYLPTAKKLPANTFVLKKAEYFRNKGSLTSLTQTFVDVWNLGDWYSRDFVVALETKINELLS